jgi:hypothetical protein
MLTLLLPFTSTMGSNSSKVSIPAGSQSTELNRAQEERLQQMLKASYMEGVQEAGFVAREREENDRVVYAAMGAAGAVMSSAATAFYMSMRKDGVDDSILKEEIRKAKDVANQIVAVKEGDLAVEKARVSELTAVSESQKNMLNYQQQVISKTNQQYNTLMARHRQLRQEHVKLRSKYTPLKLEVRGLRSANGVLNQRFITSTAGAITMALVAAGLALSSHGGHGGGDHDTHEAPKEDNAAQTNETPAVPQIIYVEKPAVPEVTMEPIVDSPPVQHDSEQVWRDKAPPAEDH